MPKPGKNTTEDPPTGDSGVTKGPDLSDLPSAVELKEGAKRSAGDAKRSVFVETESPKNELGTKDDEGKPRFDLIPPQPIIELADLFRIGVDKYAERNWELGISWGRIFSAMQSHAMKWQAGETHDQEDDQHHLIAVAWNAFVLFEYERRGMQKFNDLIPKPKRVRTPKGQNAKLRAHIKLFLSGKPDSETWREEAQSILDLLEKK